MHRMTTHDATLRTALVARVLGLLIALSVIVPAQAEVGAWGAAHNFDYDNERTLSVEVSIIRPDGSAGSARRVELLESRADQGLPPLLIDQGITDDFGTLVAQVRVPGHVKQLIVRAAVIGQANEVQVAVNDGDTIIHQFDGQPL
jgi:hypothetical protein